MWNITFLFTGAMFIALLIITFFSKQVVKSRENICFKFLLILNMIGYIIEIPMQILVRTNFDIVFIKDIFLPKLYLLLTFTWFSLFSFYTIIVCLTSKKHENKKFLGISFINLVIWFVGTILLIYMPFEHYNDGNIIYIYGGAVDVLKAILAVYMLAWIVLLLMNIKNLKDKKYIPIFLILFLLLVNVGIQTIDPSILISTMVGSFICYTMYFTLENPDVKMLEEFRIAKDRAEKANEEKEVFLYNITQDIREPLKEITKASNWLNENTRNKNVTDATYYINKNASSITDLINNVLDISTLEITNIKVYNTSYNINNIVKFIEKTYKEKVAEKVEFRIKVDSNIPTTLYGDQIRLKQAIQILLDNSIKYTKKGFIELNANSINKKDVCRLLITIEDSGEGIKPSEMEEILNKDTHLIKNDKIDESKSTIAMAKSIVNLLGGTLLIDSELGRGTKMTIVLDQKIYDEKSIELNKIETDVNKFIDNTKVLLVIEDEEYREKVIKKLSRYELDLEVVELGSKCLDNIRMSKKYDLIIMDESLTHLSSIEIITKLKEIPSFDIPVALLTENTDNKGYINNGFSYLVDKKIPSKEIEEILDNIEK